jgi:hypothetical protein
MTIIEIKNQLVSHFFDNTIFNLLTDADKITLDEETAQFREGAIRTALLELEETGMVKRVQNLKREAWILTQSFDSYNQNVQITASTAEIVAETINAFREANNISGDICDKTKITEKDIVNLLNICHALSESPNVLELADDERSFTDEEKEDDSDEL